MRFIKNTLLFLCCLQATGAFAQTIKEQTEQAMLNVNSRYKELFTSIHTFSNDKGLYQRMDTVKNYSVFVTTQYVFGDISLTEVYYAPDSTFPALVLIDGKPGRNDDSTAYKTPLQEMRERYNQYKKHQEVEYDSVQYVIHYSHKKAHQYVKERILSDYRINIALDRQHNVSTLSLQNPPRHPRFKTVLYGGKW